MDYCGPFPLSRRAWGGGPAFPFPQSAQAGAIRLRLGDGGAYGGGMAITTATYRLLGHYLGRDPLDEVADRRARGDTWRKISLAFWTEYELSVTEATLRAWYKHRAPEPERVAS